jgi:hypothetical protein
MKKYFIPRNALMCPTVLEMLPGMANNAIRLQGILNGQNYLFYLALKI